MTAVGKILVFLNLVFSLVVGAFVVMIYLARTHWVEDNKYLREQNKVLSASAETYRNEAVKSQQAADEKVVKVQAELKNVQGDLQAAGTTIADLRDRLSKAEQKSTRENAQASASVEEVVARQADVAKLRDTLRKEQETNNALVKKNADLVNEAQVAKIERQAVQDTNNRLEVQLQQMARDMARMRASGGGGTATARAGAGGGKNPPPESVEGLVKNVDREGLMTLTIGSDAGLAKGQTLELFRLNLSSPTQSRYLGTVRIMAVDPHEAVAQPVSRLVAPPRPGDQVASNILPGR